MITKETARLIYNCHQQIERIDGIKKEMLQEVEKQRKIAEEKNEPIAANSFGKYGSGLQIGVPSGLGSSMSIYNVSPELCLGIFDEQKLKLNSELRELMAIAKLELTQKT